MKYLWITTLGLFLILTNLSVAQPICDTLPSSLTKQFDSYTPKQFKKISKQKKLDPVMAFEIATYYRQKADTTCKQWYALYIDLKFRQYKSRRIHFKDKSPVFSDSRRFSIFYIAQAYYFTGNFEKAYQWYNRVYKTEFPQPCKCLDDYYVEVKRKLGKTE
jgi:hypothetical protein